MQEQKSWRVLNTSDSDAFRGVYLYLVAGIILLIAAFLFTSPASAQTDEPSVEPTTEVPAEVAEIPVVPTPEPETLAPEVVETPPPASTGTSKEAETDNTVTSADFGLKQTKILPDSRLYGFKRFGRSIKETFTFDPIKKAELSLKHASQEILDTATLLDTKEPTKKTIAAASRALEEYEEHLSDIKNNASAIQGEQSQNAPNYNQLITSVIDRQIKQQKLLDRIEKKVLSETTEPATKDLFDTLTKVKENSLTDIGVTLSTLEQNEDQLAARFNQALEQQRGTEFKDVRNLEVLKQLQERAPEQTREAIRRAEAIQLKQFSANFEQIPEEEREEQFEKFGQYFEHVDGDETRHLEFLDHLKQEENLSSESVQKIEQFRDIPARRFENRLEQYEENFDVAFREQAMERSLKRFTEGSPNIDQLRVVDDLHRRVQFKNEEIKKEMDQRRDQTIENFKESFPDADQDTERFRELSTQMAKNPDAATFRLLQELEERVKSDPKKKAFLEQMEQGVKQEFIKRATKEQEAFLSTIVSTNPEDIAIFKKLQTEFQQNPAGFVVPPGFGPAGEGTPPFQGGEFTPVGFGQGGTPPAFNPEFFDRAIKNQSEFLTDHLQNIQDPRAFEQFQKKFEGIAPDITAELNRRGEFRKVFEQKKEFIQENEIRVQEQGDRARFEAELRGRLENANSEEDRAAIQVGKQGLEAEFNAKQLDRRRESFENNLQNDPFCDAKCQEAERRNFQVELNNRKEKTKEFEQFRDLPEGIRPEERGDSPKKFNAVDEARRRESFNNEPQFKPQPEQNQAPNEFSPGQFDKNKPQPNFGPKPEQFQKPAFKQEFNVSQPQPEQTVPKSFDGGQDFKPEPQGPSGPPLGAFNPPNQPNNGPVGSPQGSGPNPSF